jgi:ribosomal protein S3AE
MTPEDPNMPFIIQFELEGMKYGIKRVISAHNEEIQKMIEDAIDNKFSNENIALIINNEVDKAIEQAIRDITQNSGIRYALQDMIVEVVKARAAPIKKRNLK